MFTGKASLSGGVGPVFAGVADPIGSGFVASLARRGGRRCRPRSFVALEPRCDAQSNDAAAVLQADAGRVLPVFENFPLAQSEFGVAAAIDHTARRARKIVQVLNCRSGEIDSRAIVGQSKVCEVVREELGFRPI